MTNVAPTRLSKSALFSFICGLLVCIPFVTGALALLLGIFGFFAAGKPGMRGRWMAVLGLILGLISIAGWSVVGVGSVAALWSVGSSAVATLTAPGTATHDFIQAVANGDDAGAKTHSSLSDADYDAAKVKILAEGGFVDSTFNGVEISNDTGHVSGTVRFKARTMNVKADLTKAADGWRVTSIEMTP